jgi:glutaminase
MDGDDPVPGGADCQEMRMDYQALVNDVLGDVHAYRGSGKVASYIPALAQADPHKFGIAVALADGSSHVAGEGDEPFTIQSISYVFSLALTLHHVKAALWNHVGREPAGTPVNSVIQLEMEKGKPRNPLTSAGALVVCDQLIGRRGRDDRSTNCCSSCGRGQAQWRSGSTRPSRCLSPVRAPSIEALPISFPPSAI